MKHPTMLGTQIEQLREEAKRLGVYLPPDDELLEAGSVVINARFLKVIMDEITANRAKIKELEEYINGLHNGTEPLTPE